MGTTFVIDEKSGGVTTATFDVVVVGAGPYGLSTATYLLDRGLKVGVFGKPLSFWREYMPEQMLLRSYWWATNISDPRKRFSLEQYFQEIGRLPVDPLPIETFIEYGLWFKHQAVPDIDETFVESVEEKEQRFLLTLSDGRVVQSQAVVMAPGLRYFTYIPDEYNHVPAELISHTADHHTFHRFAGKRLVVIGGGQGALETAALAYESGADVQVVSRSPLVWIREFGSFPERRPLLERLRAPRAGIAPGWFNWKLEHFPYHFQRLSRAKRDELLNGPGRNGPLVAAWLRSRIEGRVPLHEGQSVQKVFETDQGVALALSNGTVLQADHVMLGTGYRADINKLPMLHPQLLSRVRTYRSELPNYPNAPILNSAFESTVPGTYFLGFSSVSSCGPLYRFVVGTEAAARRVARAVSQHLAAPGRKMQRV